LQGPNVSVMSVHGTLRTFAAPQHFVRYWSNSGQTWILARDRLSANDPTATLADCATTPPEVKYNPSRVLK
jgi:hypothetical protein